MSDQFRFRKHATIGAASAEDDLTFLADCFLDTGDLATIADCNNPKRIILGRTGSGKSALINALAVKTTAITINPESLSFNFLTNSTCLQFFMDSGVKLDLFFRLLWRHVFTVELLKKRYDIRTEIAKKSFIDRIKEIVLKDKKKERALKYLEQWSASFWQETEYRIKEITKKIEEELTAQIDAKLQFLCGNVSGANKLSQEEKAEVLHKGQKVINAIQMRELSDILDFLNDDVFDDCYNQHFICIDKLDENWVDSKFKFLLIRSLIETVRDFLKVRHVKIVVVLRTELIDRVFRYTRDEGFQEEKYRSLYLNLKWSKDQLITLLDRRVNHLVKKSYTKKAVKYDELLPNLQTGKPSIDYILDRTMMRPRELIEFFNLCIERAEDSPIITKSMLLSAEADYSKYRLRSLQDEWYADYPALADFVFILRKVPTRFSLEDLNNNESADFCLDYTLSHSDRRDDLSMYSRNCADGIIEVIDFLQYLFHILYRTGVVGLKIESYEGYQWSQDGPSTISHHMINAETLVSVHPVFWSLLGIKPDRK